MVNARTAKASDFKKSAQLCADTAWVGAIITGCLAYFLVNWYWAIIPAIWTLFSIVRSVSASLAAGKIRAGTYSIPNINNGLDT
jgi:hypothetical protein